MTKFHRSTSDDLWLTLPEYAKRYGIHYNTAVKWLREGLLVVYTVSSAGGHHATRRVKNQPPGKVSGVGP